MPPLPAALVPPERINSEIFTLTYGSIVRQLITDLEDVNEVNKELDKMGYNIGTRCASASPVRTCPSRPTTTFRSASTPHCSFT